MLYSVFTEKLSYSLCMDDGSETVPGCKTEHVVTVLIFLVGNISQGAFILFDAPVNTPAGCFVQCFRVQFFGFGFRPFQCGKRDAVTKLLRGSYHEFAVIFSLAFFGEVPECFFQLFPLFIRVFQIIFKTFQFIHFCFSPLLYGR